MLIIIVWLTCQAINITGLQPDTLYTVRLSAFTEAGEGPYEEFTVQTDEDGNLIFCNIVLLVLSCFVC